jgi:pyrroline-5-carboxylate reductase
MATRIGVLGLGKMGEALVRGLQGSSHAAEFSFEATTRSKETAAEAGRRLGIEVHTDNGRLAASCKVIVLCVKPHQAGKVLESIAEQLTEQHLLISVCASLDTEALSEWAGERAAIVRAMPNTPCLIGEGMTVFCAGPNATTAHLALVERMFNTVGRAIAIEESLMDGATGLSGCGPAYVYLVIEALSEAGVKVGLQRKTATLLAAQTLAGSARMVLQRGEHPAALKDEVTTPAGCTIDGLMALEEGKLRVALIKAVLAASRRSRKLSKS